ncbi:response regulator, partial [Klebsiella pneumoniae]|nr:response regulator [Klebsiella pneumoniae]
LEQALRQADLAARLTCVWQKGVRRPERIYHGKQTYPEQR